MRKLRFRATTITSESFWVRGYKSLDFLMNHFSGGLPKSRIKYNKLKRGLK